MARARCKMETVPLSVLRAFSLFEPYVSNSFHVYVTLTLWSGASPRTYQARRREPEGLMESTQEDDG